MARVFISFLGTNDYLPCTYFKDDKQVRNVRFVQEATLSFFCSKWTRDDRILIFTTNESYKKNWLDNGHIDSKTDSVLDQKGLACCIEALGLLPGIKSVPIPDGKNEDEIWEIFNEIFACLNEGDELLFDITHAFRSIPMLAMVILNYAKVMKGISLIGIYYGAFEVLGSQYEALAIPLRERLVPIFDLTVFDVLLDWATAIDRFLGTGDAVPVCRLADKAVKPILKSTRGSDNSAVAIRNMAVGLEKFSRAISTCRGREISNRIAFLKKEIIKCENLDIIQPFRPIFERIQEQMDRFNGNAIPDGIRAAGWCLDHNLIQQGYTILEETIISYFVLRIGEDPEDLENKNREIATQAMHIYNKGLDKSKWKKPAKDYPAITKRFVAFYRSQHSLAKVFSDIAGFRNDLNHAGYKPNAMDAVKFKRKLSELIDDAAKYIEI